MEQKGRKNMYGRTEKDYESIGKERIWNRKAERMCMEEPIKTMRGQAKKGYVLCKRKIERAQHNRKAERSVKIKPENHSFKTSLC